LRGLNKPAGVLGISEQEKELQQSMLKEMLAAAKAGQVPGALRRRIEPPGKPANSAAARAAAEGWQQFNAGQLRAAELSFNRALAKDPENLAAMNGLGFSCSTRARRLRPSSSSRDTWSSNPMLPDR
jgi:hypothetical protein